MSLQEPAQCDPVGACQTVPRKEDPHPAVEQIPVASTDGLNARLCRQIPLSRARNYQRVALPRDRLAGLADRMHRLRRQRVANFLEFLEIWGRSYKFFREAVRI